MTASIAARLSSKEKFIVIIALFSLISWHIPGIRTAYAKTDDQQNTSKILEIKTQIDLSDLEKQKEQEIAFEKLNKKVALLRAYLQSKNAPLADYSEFLLAQEDWKKIIAISNSESSLGAHCYYNNCSGIFGPNGLRTYKT